MKIGILTFHSSINYGAFLQSYSLQWFMRNRYEGIDIQIINYTANRSYNSYLDRILWMDEYGRDMCIRQYNAFMEDWSQLILSENKLISDSFSEFEKFVSGYYDTIIVGSDELWRTDGMRGFPNVYWLNFDLKKTNIKSFAVSGRNCYGNLKDCEKQYIRQALEKYDYIGVRDKITKLELKEVGIDKSIYLNPDPTLLQTDHFRKIALDFRQTRRKYALLENELILSLMISSDEIALHCNDAFSEEYKVCNLYEPRIMEGAIDLSFVGPFEWCRLLAASDFIITDFYHGMLFSLIYKKNFFAIEKAIDGSGKIEDFLNRNGLNFNLIYQKEYQNSRDLVAEIMSRKSIFNDMNYKKVYDGVIKNEIQYSNTFFEKLDKEIFPATNSIEG